MQARLDAERTRPGGRLHPTRSWASEYGFNPTPWFTRASLKVSAGERVDVQANRVGRGAEFLLDAKLRASLAGIGLESEQQVQHSVIKRGGARALTDSAAQWLGVVHFSARDSLRAVWQATRYRREADAQAAIAAERVSSPTASALAAAWRSVPPHTATTPAASVVTSSSSKPPLRSKNGRP